MELILFLAASFLFTLLVGILIEKIRVPWIFAALILGVLLAVHNPFSAVTSSDTFKFIAGLGMYFLLFIIGLEIDLKEVIKRERFIVKATLFIILLEAVFGTLLVHFVFNCPWLISILVALSFATVGEAVLIPILDEFKIVNTDLGQAIIGIGVLDDLIEVFTIIWICVLIGSEGDSFGIGITLISLILLFLLAFGLTKLKKEGRRFVVPDIEALFLFVMFVFFLFIGVGKYADASPLGALLAGIALKNFIPKERLGIIESEVKTMCYGFFAPIFFLWVGVSVNINYLTTYPLLILLVVSVSKGSKLLGSYLIARREFGIRKSILLGIGLSVRFSTSIVIIKILFENALIGVDLYSVLIASSIVFKFIIPLLFSQLLVRWGIARK